MSGNVKLKGGAACMFFGLLASQPDNALEWLAMHRKRPVAGV